MMMLLGAASLPAIALILPETSIDAVLWSGIAICAVSLARDSRPRSSMLTGLVAATAALLTSLALVSA